MELYSKDTDLIKFLRPLYILVAVCLTPFWFLASLFKDSNDGIQEFSNINLIFGVAILGLLGTFLKGMSQIKSLKMVMYFLVIVLPLLVGIYLLTKMYIV